MNHVLASPSSSVPGAASLTAHEAKEATAKDVGEDVVHPRATPASFPQTLFSIPIVELLLLRVSEHVVSKADFLKLDRKEGKIKTFLQTLNLNRRT